MSDLRGGGNGFAFEPLGQPGVQVVAIRRGKLTTQRFADERMSERDRTVVVDDDLGAEQVREPRSGFEVAHHDGGGGRLRDCQHVRDPHRSVPDCAHPLADGFGDRPRDVGVR